MHAWQQYEGDLSSLEKTSCWRLPLVYHYYLSGVSRKNGKRMKYNYTVQRIANCKECFILYHYISAIFLFINLGVHLHPSCQVASLDASSSSKRNIQGLCFYDMQVILLTIFHLINQMHMVQNHYQALWTNKGRLLIIYSPLKKREKYKRTYPI